MGLRVERQTSNGSDEPGRGKTSAKGQGIRVSEELFGRAEEHARITHRSPPKQIEYWSQLGRILENSLGSVELYALLAGTKSIATLRLASAEVPDMATVRSELDADRVAGALAASVTSAPVSYDLADDGVTLRRHDADGAIACGALVDGTFVAHASG